VDNAIKYTKEGGVTVSVKRQNNKVVCCVKDTGVGLSPKDRDKIFKKFSCGESSAATHTEGLGLGLYVARMMLSAHKGKIWVESPASLDLPRGKAGERASRGGGGAGKGSEFCFSLPNIR